MKKLFVLFSSILILTSSFAYRPPSVDEQLLRSFAINFPNAQKVIWQELQEAYIVSFIEDGIRIRITYLRNGNVTHLIRYYQEENLPLDIRFTIKQKFPKKTIFGVIEENLISNIQNLSKIIYHVTLEDESSWTKIKVEKHKRPKVVDKFNKQI